MLRGKKIKLNTPQAESSKSSNLSMNIHNRFDIEIVDAKTGDVKQKVEAFNTICDNLWTRVCNWESYGYARYIHYGSGSGSPSTSDTSLFSFLGQKAATVESNTINYADGIYTVQRSIQLAENEEVDKTISEVGVAYGTGSDTLCTHAILRDMNGNPVTIVKTGTDIINIYSTIYVHFNKYGYDNGSIQVYKGSNSKNLLDFLAGSDACLNPGYSYTYTKGYVYNQGGYAIKYDSSTYRDSFNVSHTGNVSNKTLTLTMSRIPAASCNNGGFQYIDFAQYNVSYGTSSSGRFGLCARCGGNWYPYSQITSEAVGTGDGSTIIFDLDFEYAKEAKVYIDGVEAPSSSYSVRYGVTDPTNFKYYMDFIREESTVNHLVYNYTIASTFTKLIMYNPMYEIGLKSLNVSNSNFTLYASNDLSTWAIISNPTAISSTYQHYKFWRIESTDSTSSLQFYNLTVTPISEARSAIIFKSAPQNGAVITADYKSDSIAKDANHVFDLSLTISLGEYVE